MPVTEAAANKAINSLKRIANWEITGLLGEGGFGRVLKAKKRLVNGDIQLAAIKVINPARLEDDQNAFQRFAHEYELMKSLESPYVSRVLDSGQEPIQVGSGVHILLWIATELIPGENLDEEISQHGILDKSQWLELAHDLLTAVAETHEKGVVHLDIKPGNIMRHARRSILVDFGIGSKVLVEDPGNHGGTTPGFGSPEQIDGKTSPADLGYESDIFSIGTTLVYAGTGLTPWDIKQMAVPRNKAEANQFQVIRSRKLYQDFQEKKPRLKGLDEEQKILVEQMIQFSPKMRASAAVLLAQVKALLPEGSLRKQENTNVKPVRSVPQFLRDPRAEKLLNKSKNTANPNSETGPGKIDRTPRSLVDKDSSWWLGLRTSILLILTGPIGIGIRFYFLQKQKASNKFAQLDRQIVATVFGVMTFGFALPFIAFEWYKQTKLARYRNWALYTFTQLVGIIGVTAWGTNTPPDSLAYTLTGGIAFVLVLIQLILIPVLGFKSPDYKSIAENSAASSDGNK